MAKDSFSSTRKKVVVRLLDARVVKGYVDFNNFLGANGVEVLDREGHLLSVPLETVKAVYFVRDFEGQPDRADRNVFRGRPKRNGIWIRLAFKDNEVLEGLMPNNLLAVESSGFMITPADLSSNNLRVFVPRGALGVVEVLGVVANGTARRSLPRSRQVRAKLPGEPAQIGLFPSSNQSESQ